MVLSLRPCLIKGFFYGIRPSTLLCPLVYNYRVYRRYICLPWHIKINLKVSYILIVHFFLTDKIFMGCGAAVGYYAIRLYFYKPSHAGMG